MINLERPARLPRVKAESLPEQVRAIIQEKIVSGELPAGERLLELKLAKEMGVGQIVIREALIRLSEAGFVQRLPRMGTRVTKLTRSDVERIYRVRTALESLSIELILERFKGKELDVTELDRTLAKVKEAMRRGDFVAYHKWDLHFHRFYWKLADNNYLTAALEKLIAPLSTYYFVKRLTHPQNGSWRLGPGSHDRIVEALKCRRLSIARKDFQEMIDNMRLQDSMLVSGSGEVPATDEPAGIRILPRGKPSERRGI